MLCFSLWVLSIGKTLEYKNRLKFSFFIHFSVPQVHNSAIVLPLKSVAFCPALLTHGLPWDPCLSNESSVSHSEVSGISAENKEWEPQTQSCRTVGAGSEMLLRVVVDPCIFAQIPLKGAFLVQKASQATAKSQDQFLVTFLNQHIG